MGLSRFRVALLGLVAAIALVGAGCGGDDDSSNGPISADAWAEDFCTTVSAWTDELREIGDSVGDPSSVDVDVLKQAVEDASAATESFVDDLRALGPPDTDSGDEVEQSIETLADTVDGEKSKVEQAVNDLSGVTDLPSAITTIGTSLQAMGTALQQSLEALEDADADNELETALEESEACDELAS